MFCIPLLASACLYSSQIHDLSFGEIVSSSFLPSSVAVIPPSGVPHHFDDRRRTQFMDASTAVSGAWCLHLGRAWCTTASGWRRFPAHADASVFGCSSFLLWARQFSLPLSSVRCAIMSGHMDQALGLHYQQSFPSQHLNGHSKIQNTKVFIMIHRLAINEFGKHLVICLLKFKHFGFWNPGRKCRGTPVYCLSVGVKPYLCSVTMFITIIWDEAG